MPISIPSFLFFFNSISSVEKLQRNEEEISEKLFQQIAVFLPKNFFVYKKVNSGCCFYSYGTLKRTCFHFAKKPSAFFFFLPFSLFSLVDRNCSWLFWNVFCFQSFLCFGFPRHLFFAVASFPHFFRTFNSVETFTQLVFWDLVDNPIREKKRFSSFFLIFLETT